MSGPAVTDTIYALSSGSPPAAIAVVRLSGPLAGAALEQLAGRIPPARRATLVTLREDGAVLDRALALFLPGPASATGEDLAEFHLHGGRATVARVLDALGRIDGLKAAEPGEFTRRAFENGRIDLAEAEGLADLLFAETEGQRLSALAMAEGGLSARVNAWRERLLGLAARVEALLDFSDEDDVGEDAALRDDLGALASEMRAMLRRPTAERLKEGVRVALAGPPNAGKSTLLNALCGRDVAITSSRAGTTRDVIEAPLAISGRPFLFIDMAGLHRGTGDEIEAEGMERARVVIATSDVVLWLGDDAKDMPANAIRLWARCDLPDRSRPPGVELGLSAVTGEGLDRLTDLLLLRADTLLPRPGEVALNRRQRDCISDAAIELVYDADPIILAEHLRCALAAIDRLTGQAGTEHMLDVLFGKFCIGK